MSTQWVSFDAAAAFVQAQHQVVMRAGDLRPPMDTYPEWAAQDQAAG